MSVFISYFGNLISITLGTIVFPLQRLKIPNFRTTTLRDRLDVVYFPSKFCSLPIITFSNKSTTIIKTPNTSVHTRNILSFFPYKKG